MLDTGYCWRHECLFPHESLRSILCKFMLLNHTSIADIQKVFCFNISDDLIKGTSIKGNNFLISEKIFERCIQPKRIISLLGISSEQLKFSVIEPYAVVDYYNDKFKFCPSCLKLGYHSPLHQLKMFAKCPIHGEYLRDSCVNCSCPVDYKLNSSIYNHPYSCAHCGHVHILSDRAIENKLGLVISNFTNVFMRFAEKKKLCYEKIIIKDDCLLTETELFKYIIHTNYEKCHQREIFLGASRWSHVVNEPDLAVNNLSSTFRTSNHYSQIYSTNLPEIGSKNIIKSNGEYSFRAEYKSIKRYFRKLLLGKPVQIRRKIRRYERSLFKRKYYLHYPKRVETTVDTNDILSSTYYQFSLRHDFFLKTITDIEFFFDKSQSELNNFVRRDDILGSIKQQVLDRIFADKCMTAMVEYLLRALVQRKHGHLVFDQFSHDGRYDSHWIINANCSDVIALHLWSKGPRLSTVVNYIKKHNF